MESEIGRYLEGRLLPAINLIKLIHDLGTGAGYDVSAWIDGRQLVFTRDVPGSGRGFLRLIPQESSIILCFPRGHEILDPKKRAKGPPGSETRLLVRDPSDVDGYVRRMIDAAYSLEG